MDECNYCHVEGAGTDTTGNVTISGTSTTGGCPYCDPPRCPHCGRILSPYNPYPIYPIYPYWPQPHNPWWDHYTWCSSDTTGGSTSGVYKYYCY